MKKQVTEITERKTNGGMHNQKAYKRITSMLFGHGYSHPRLYHLVILDAIEGIDASRFQKALKTICLQLRKNNIDCRWRACLERDENKGLHFHVFILCNANNKNSCSIINTQTTGWLRTYLKKKCMTFHLCPPQAPIHRVQGVSSGKRKNYATLAGKKLDDCLEWMSYLVKRRSKPDDIKYIYFSSRDSRAKFVAS